MRTFVIMIFLGAISCAGNFVNKGNKTEQTTSIVNRIYVDYFEGEELNSLQFYEMDYEYTNAEMETTETGHFKYVPQSKYLELHREWITYPSGEKDSDSTIFLLQVPNDTTINYISRVTFNSTKGMYDTLPLNNLPMYLKR